MYIIKASIESLKEGGVKLFLTRTKYYLKNKTQKRVETITQKNLYPSMVDVLFINGCDSSVPHPPR